MLDTGALFSLPAGRRTPDGQSRVGARRLVVGSSRRSTLGDWVLSCDAFEETGPERETLGQLLAITKVPDTTTPQQAAAFLQWVWSSEPDADSVRQLLPRAYQYALELSQEETESLRQDAKVFVTARHWVRIGDGGVFLNDLEVADKELLAADREMLLATPGHLGDDDATRLRVCELLHLERASVRYRVGVDHDIQGATTPDHWRSGFLQAQRRFWRELAGSGDDDSGVKPPEFLELVRVGAINRRLLKDGEEIDESAELVAVDEGRALVVGEPFEFASSLAEALIEHWGITLRRDGYALGSRLTSLLFRIDRESSADLGDTQPGSDTGKSGEAGDGSHGEAGDASGGETGGGQSGKDASGTNVGPGQGKATHTSKQKDGLQAWLLARRKELALKLRDVERQIKEGLSAESLPDEEMPPETTGQRPFGDDAPYRQAVVEYEQLHQRFPEVRDEGQAGYDIDSYSHESGHPDRALLRRIEVKGKGAAWTGAEIVDLSDRQLKDALSRSVNDGERQASEFDYWLYVVEHLERRLPSSPHPQSGSSLGEV